MTDPVRLYIALRRTLASPPARRQGETVRIPIDGRTCVTKIRGGKRCGSERYRKSRERGPVCVACGRAWPTRIVIESVRATRNREPQERERDLCSDLGALIARLPLWQRRVLKAWQLQCEDCGKRVPHQHGRWRHHEVAEHLARHYPRAQANTNPRRVAVIYDEVGEVMEGKFGTLEKAYGRSQ